MCRILFTMITILFAHAGEKHESTTQAAAHLSQDTTVLWLILLLVPVVIAFFTHSVFKLKLLNSLLFISMFLIAFSVYTYQNPGAHTLVAMAGGFSIVFITALLRMGAE